MSYRPGMSLLAVLLITCTLTGCTIGPTAEDGSPAPTAAPASPAVATTDAASSSEPATITIAAAGDILAHTMVGWSAADVADAEGSERTHDYAPLFNEVKGLISSADLALCQLETPIAASDADVPTEIGTMVFNSPPDLAPSIKDVGYDACSFASNHSMDQGLDGIAITEQAVRAAGLGFAGPTMNQQNAGVAEPLPAGDATVGYLAYAYTLPNASEPTVDVPEAAPWLERALWPAIGAEQILADARAARERGADFVVTYLHWGTEYQQEPTQDQRDIARTLLESDDVDLVLGSHAHVIQGCEVINGKHVLYGMGNSISNQSPDMLAELSPSTQDGLVAQLTLHKASDGTVTTDFAYQPTWVDVTDGHKVRAVTPETNPDSYARTEQALNSLGGCQATSLA